MNVGTCRFLLRKPALQRAIQAPGGAAGPDKQLECDRTWCRTGQAGGWAGDKKCDGCAVCSFPAVEGPAPCEILVLACPSGMPLSSQMSDSEEILQ